jgi:hypothetical protein
VELGDDLVDFFYGLFAVQMAFGFRLSAATRVFLRE